MRIGPTLSTQLFKIFLLSPARFRLLQLPFHKKRIQEKLQDISIVNKAVNNNSFYN